MGERDKVTFEEVLALESGAREFELRNDGSRLHVRLTPQADATEHVDPQIGAKRLELLLQMLAASNEAAARIPDNELDQALREMKRGGLQSLAPLAAGAAAVDTWEADLASIPPANAAALLRSRARAAASRQAMLQRPDMLSGDAFAARIGVTRATVDNRRIAGRLLALELGNKRGLRYPQWQVSLSLDAARRAALERTLKCLAPAGAWSAYRFFVTAQPALGGAVPHEALLAGVQEPVFAAADTWAEGDQGGG